jgi:Electron transfer DM13
MSTTLAPRRLRRRLASLLAAPAVAAAVLAGVWVTGGVISDDFRTSMALTAAWFALSGAACALVAWRVRGLRVAVLGAYLVTAAVVSVYLGVTTLRDRVVDERVVTAAPAAADPGPAGDGSAVAPAVEEARAPFRSLEHATTGTAAVVRLADGRRFLTLIGFETSPGPDLRVRLAPGDTSDGGADGALDLGALKGNRGDQQYELPRDVDVAGTTVIIWCRAFSAPFGSAQL